MFFKKSKSAEKVEEKTLSVRKESSLSLLAYQQARANHLSWVADKIKHGYIYGPVTNDDPQKGQLTSHLIVPYDELDTITKQLYLKDAIKVIRIMQEYGL